MNYYSLLFPVSYRLYSITTLYTSQFLTLCYIRREKKWIVWQSCKTFDRFRINSVKTQWNNFLNLLSVTAARRQCGVIWCDVFCRVRWFADANWRRQEKIMAHWHSSVLFITMAFLKVWTTEKRNCLFKWHAIIVKDIICSISFPPLRMMCHRLFLRHLQAQNNSWH